MSTQKYSLHISLAHTRVILLLIANLLPTDRPHRNWKQFKTETRRYVFEEYNIHPPEEQRYTVYSIHISWESERALERHVMYAISIRPVTSGMRCVLSHLKQHTENAEGESLTERNSCPIRDTFSISMFIKSFKEISVGSVPNPPEVIYDNYLF